jgi:hypothetical protein
MPVEAEAFNADILFVLPLRERSREGGGWGERDRDRESHTKTQKREEERERERQKALETQTNLEPVSKTGTGTGSIFWARFWEGDQNKRLLRTGPGTEFSILLASGTGIGTRTEIFEKTPRNNWNQALTRG